MFGFVKSKTSIIILILLFVACAFAWGAIEVGIGNYIPISSTSKRNSAGVFIVARTEDLNGELDADGNSSLHYIRTYVGDTTLRFDASSGKDDVKTYNDKMISSIITCHDNSSITLTLNMDSARHGNAGYNCKKNGVSGYYLPYLLVVVKVSNFSPSHDSFSTDFTEWLYDPNSTCKYTVLAVLDSRDVSTHVASNLTIENGECLHIVMVPFAYSNDTYFDGANVYTGTAEYRARYEASFSYSYENSSGNTITGTSKDGMDTIANITQVINEFDSLSFGCTTTVATLSLSQMIENASATVNPATTMAMSYAKYTTGTTIDTRTLHISIYPYNNLDEYYFFRSGTANVLTNRYFPANLKVSNISPASGVTFEYKENGVSHTKNVSNGETFDTAQYGPEFSFRLTTTTETISSGSFKRKTSADLSFDVFPYIETIPNVLGGDYTMIIVAEFSIDE